MDVHRLNPFSLLQLSPRVDATCLRGSTALLSNFISTHQRDRRADCIWQVKRREGDLLYLLILLEHQSAADPIMSIRIMGYAALLYEDWVMRGLQHMSDANQPLPSHYKPLSSTYLRRISMMRCASSCRAT